MESSDVEAEAEVKPLGDEVEEVTQEAPTEAPQWLPGKPDKPTDELVIGVPDELKESLADRRYMPKMMMKAYKPINMMMWQFFGIYRWYKTRLRAFRVLSIIFKYIFVFAFSGFVDRHFRGEDVPPRTKSIMLRNLIEDLGPTYIKFGQVLSNRPNMPPEIIKEFRKLQDKAPPFSYNLAAEQIRKELDAPVEEIFDFFDKKHIATASIGQVHRARLKTGEDVAVKIQRPGIESVVETDLLLLSKWSRRLERFTAFKKMQVKITVEAFANALRRELDYIIEGRSCDRFAAMYDGDETVHIPKVYWDYTTKRVLVLEFIDGVKIDEIWRMEDKWGLDPYQVAVNACHAGYKQVYEYGFFHADPHPSNIFVMEDNVIAFLDFGMMGRVDKEMRSKFADLGLSAWRRDLDAVMAVILDIVEVTEFTDVNAMRNDISDAMDRHYTPDGKVIVFQHGMGSAVDELVLGVLKHDVILPEDIILMVKASVYIEGLAAKLVPDFDIMGTAEPYLLKVAKDRAMDIMDPMGLHKGGIKEAALGVMTRLGQMSDRISLLMDKLEKGEISINVTHNEPERTKKYRGLKTIVLILIALILGSMLF